MRLVLLVLLLVNAAFAQEPTWRVITGDNPAFAQPEFDDSGWAAATGPRLFGGSWVAGVRWYRATFPIPEAWRGRRLAVGMGPLPHAYAVYVEGTRIGQFGAWSPKEVIYAVRHESFEIPAELTRKGQVPVAIRRFARRIGTGWLVHVNAGGNQYPHSPAVGPADRIAETETLHTQAGFTQPQELDGRMVLANAGHLMPYAAGAEVAVEIGLPPGIVETEYAETLGRFESLLLVSDGVVKAAQPDGELFGFERTREMSDRSAAELAEAAQAWGQNDDISVVTVRSTT